MVCGRHDNLDRSRHNLLHPPHPILPNYSENHLPHSPTLLWNTFHLGRTVIQRRQQSCPHLIPTPTSPASVSIHRAMGVRIFLTECQHPHSLTYILTALYPGSTFSGSQRSGASSYDVTVTIVVRHTASRPITSCCLICDSFLQSTDFASSVLCGYLRIRNLTKDYPELTTYFHAEIIGSRYGFLTDKEWGATESDDLTHWSKFGAFRSMRNQLKRPGLTLRDHDRGTVFMRWKERFLVPDHKTKEINGARSVPQSARWWQNNQSCCLRCYCSANVCAGFPRVPSSLFANECHDVQFRRVLLCCCLQSNGGLILQHHRLLFPSPIRAVSQLCSSVSLDLGG